MADDKVKLPGVGKQNKKTVYLAGGAVAILAIMIYRKKKAAAAAAAAAATTTTTAQIDPATGYAYGSPQDATALAGQSAYANPVSYGGGGGPSYGGQGVSNVLPGPTPTGGYTSNPQWAQAVESYLSSNGAPFADVSSAIGKYLTGQPITDPQAVSYVEQAIAAQGQPPVAGSDGYPPSIRTSMPNPSPIPNPNPSPNPGPNPGPTPVTGPLAPTTVRVIGSRKGAAAIEWTAVPNADSYMVYHDSKPYKTTSQHSMTVYSNGSYAIQARHVQPGPGYSPLSNTVIVSGI